MASILGSSVHLPSSVILSSLSQFDFRQEEMGEPIERSSSSFLQQSHVRDGGSQLENMPPPLQASSSLRERGTSLSTDVSYNRPLSHPPLRELLGIASSQHGSMENISRFQVGLCPTSPNRSDLI